MQETDFSVLPEGCITNILSFTSPRDACTSSLVSSTFKSAADSDVVWEKFLPSDYKDIVSRSGSSLSLNGFPSRKDLYFRLCGEPVLLDGGNKTLNLEKNSGKKCFVIGARELEIHWGDSPQHWKWIPESDSRFGEVAELVGVCWLFVKGKIDTHTLSPKTTYVAYLVIRFTENAHGLDHPPADVCVEFAGQGNSAWASGTHSVYLDPECNRRPLVNFQPHRLGLVRRRYGHILRSALSNVRRYEGQFPIDRKDGWMEIEMGEFYNDQGDDGEVTMTLKETNSGHWKGGLIVEGIELRPKMK
ncbi:hypothetical protein ACHQM5_027707 [Ranunculus cassubicifolius]